MHHAYQCLFRIEGSSEGMCRSQYQFCSVSCCLHGCCEMQIVLCSHTCNPQVPPTVNATGGSQCFFLRQPPTNPTGFRGRPGVSRWVPACAPNLVLRCAPACALAQWGTKLGACAGAHRGTKLGVTSVGPMGNHWPKWGGQDGAQAEAQVGTKSPLVPTACSPLWTNGLPLRVFQMGGPSSIPAPKTNTKRWPKD